jgi:hypothetical protein
VTTIAVPEPKTLVAPFVQLDSAAWALGIFTAVLGRAPQFDGDTWVWTDVSPVGTHGSISVAAFDACTTPQIYESPSRLAVPDCVLKALHPGRVSRPEG